MKRRLRWSRWCFLRDKFLLKFFFLISSAGLLQKLEPPRGCRISGFVIWTTKSQKRLCVYEAFFSVRLLSEQKSYSWVNLTRICQQVLFCNTKQTWLPRHITRSPPQVMIWPDQVNAKSLPGQQCYSAVGFVFVFCVLFASPSRWSHLLGVVVYQSLAVCSQVEKEPFKYSLPQWTIWVP